MRSKLGVLAILSLLPVLACKKAEKEGQPSPTAPAATAAAAPAAAPVAAVAPDSMKVDKVAGEGGPLKTDKENDGAFTLTVDGPVAGIVLLTTDKTGKPEGGQQWDTYEEDQKIPAAIDAPFQIGEPTWQLGVFENGKSVNAADGSLKPLPAGKHVLTLYAADSGHFKAGETLIVWVERPDHTVVRSNVITY